MKKTTNKTIHLPILIETDEDNYFIVSCPVFKGCHSFGKTVDEAMKNIREVIDMCLEEDEQSQPLNHFLGYREMEVLLPAKAKVR
ncbi:MAG: type II toxin-antitoxin system HicB family antitoxin [Bacteroidia bacterium]